MPEFKEEEVFQKGDENVTLDEIMQRESDYGNNVDDEAVVEVYLCDFHFILNEIPSIIYSHVKTK